MTRSPICQRVAASGTISAATHYGNWTYQFAALVAIMLLIGCGQSGKGIDPSTDQVVSELPNVPAQTSEKDPCEKSKKISVRSPITALAAASLDKVDVRGRKGIDLWTAESFHEQAQRRLAELISLLAENRLTAASRLCDEQFSTTPLRPQSLAVVFTDEALEIRRPQESLVSASSAAKPKLGGKQFIEALTWLRSPFPKHARLYGKFKVFRVELSDEQAEDRTAVTTAYYELNGETDSDSGSESDSEPERGGVLQQNATWRCTWRQVPNDKPLLISVEVLQYEESVSQGEKGPLFADCTESLLGANRSYTEQLLYSTNHWLGRIPSIYGLDPSSWQGVSVGDVNGDGLDDLYVCLTGGTPNRLYVQNADGTATDVSHEAGVDWWDHSHSSLLVDLDNDGDQDLVVSTTLGVIMMANDGTGHFTVRLTKLTPEAMPFSLTASDYDGDGHLDIYACCYGLRPVHVGRGFLARPLPYHDANNGGRNLLWKNDGNWGFRDVAREVGLEDNNRRFSLAGTWEDYDNDGDQDLSVANDYGRNNLYRNDDGRFTDVAAGAGVEDISAGMSAVWGDCNNDGLMDLYVSNMWSSAGNRVTFQRQFQQNVEDSTRAEFQRHARGNSLFLNRGNGTFEDVSQREAVTMGRWAWGSRFVDINNDGLQDLVVANGFITGAKSGDL